MSNATEIQQTIRQAGIDFRAAATRATASMKRFDAAWRAADPEMAAHVDAVAAIQTRS